MKNGKLNGKVAVVTRASKGIAGKIAMEFASEGASVVVNYACPTSGTSHGDGQLFYG
jgi:3-oxoacyl-[acyl-carrier protein] reductase